MTLPGSPTIYYGDEIGMTNVNVSSPNNARSPMQWNVDANAGFCGNCTPWNEVNMLYLNGSTVQVRFEGNCALESMIELSGSACGTVIVFPGGCTKLHPRR